MNTGKPTTEEIEIAFVKLQAYNYFDNYDLIFRKKIADYKRSINSRLRRFSLQFDRKKPFSKEIEENIGLILLPKQVKTIEGLPNNYYTNARILDGNEISKPVIYFDGPIETFLIATIWVMRYGAFLESKLSKNALGNRLIINRETKDVVEGRSLFKPYYNQFQKWWSLAIHNTKELLQAGENATILNFDLKSFYHNVEFDFEELEKELKKHNRSIVNDPIHILLKRIHRIYKERLSVVYPKITENRNPDKYPLPIGLFSSNILANWYLTKLDRFIEKNIRPIYYGRYVDDILIVIKDTLVERNEIAHIEQDGNIVDYYLEKYFDTLFKRTSEKSYSIRVKGLENLDLNSEKLFVYQFDAEYSPNLMESFVDEQKERNSMFRFLSDEEDEFFGDFDTQTFESNFDHIDANKARFKNIEDNKYKLSAFLSKLIKRRVQKGRGYKDDEVDKISRYFKSIYLIKHYYFWEKLFTLYVVYKKPQKIINLIEEISSEITKIKIEVGDFYVTKKDYQRSLLSHLEYSVKMALGLNMTLVVANKELRKTITRTFYKSTTRNLSQGFEDIIDDLSVFKNSGLLRGAFIFYPLVQFTNYTKDNIVDLTDSNLIFAAIKQPKHGDFNIDKPIRRYIPFRIKYWQAALLAYYNNFIYLKPNTTANNNYWHTDSFMSEYILDEAFDLFYETNNPIIEKDVLKEQYFQSYTNSKHNHKQPDSEFRIPENRRENYITQELYLPNSGKHRDNLRVTIVNHYVASENFIKSLNGTPDTNAQRMEMFDQLLDQLSQISKCDLYILPELALPHSLLAHYIDQSARKQIAVITGVEYIRMHGFGFNFIATVLPVYIDGDRDAIPILRLKNHYAPEEEALLRRKRIQIPKPNPYRYDLFEWRGFYFSSYYCYELADVFHRSAFFSKIDVLFSSVWNLDTHYYNNIIDTATRDMHCYIVLVNTSQYGYSKVSRPRDFINKEKIIVKGGTEDGYSFTLLVGELKIKELREFQKLNYEGQKASNNEKKSFKPTPPDFPVENVEKRINNERFT